ncbi:MAG: class I SAM-dependent methyltransferase [Bacilli bacterium]|nr:class I SAM-dependent methyltransferase [Bacilli bacterium]MDD4808864.1 class I SAM-dependent methyltransferase [Bacilli bacterium]
MDHYFTNNSNLKSNIKEIKVYLNNQEYRFLTDSGVFSKKGLDFGTRTLLENIPVLNGNVLDFGCGYGPIGIYIKKNNDCTVDMIDINERSLELARKNALKNKVEVNLFKSDIYSEVTNKYDYIITNPPIRVGKTILYEILMNAKDYLNPHGELWLVIHKDQGANSLVKDLKAVYEVEIIVKNKGFYVIRAISN